MLKTFDNYHITFLCMLLALLAPVESKARPDDDMEATISASLLYFDYQEFSDLGRLLDREEGFIPGVALGLRKSAGQWVFAGQLAYHSGDTPYTGYTTSGIPIKTTTQQNIVDIALHTEYWQQGLKGPDYAIYLGAAYHQWERNILSTTTASGAAVSGLFETYTWWTGFMGMKSELFASAYGNCLMDVRLLQTINPSIRVNFNGTYDNTSLALGERWGARISFPWRYSYNSASSWNIEPYAESYEFGRSATTPLTYKGTVSGSVFEPRSQTNIYGITVGFSQHF